MATDCCVCLSLSLSAATDLSRIWFVTVFTSFFTPSFLLLLFLPFVGLPLLFLLLSYCCSDSVSLFFVYYVLLSTCLPVFRRISLSLLLLPLQLLSFCVSLCLSLSLSLSLLSFFLLSLYLPLLSSFVLFIPSLPSSLSSIFSVVLQCVVSSLPPFLPSCLPSFLVLPSFLPPVLLLSFLPFFLPAFFHVSCRFSFLPSILVSPVFLPCFLPSFLPAFCHSMSSVLLPSFLRSLLFLLASQDSSLLSVFPASFLPSSFFSCLSSFLAAPPLCGGHPNQKKPPQKKYVHIHVYIYMYIYIYTCTINYEKYQKQALRKQSEDRNEGQTCVSCVFLSMLKPYSMSS